VFNNVNKGQTMSSMREKSSGSNSSPGLLVGRFDYALDPKKRFTIPSGWRDVMGAPAYVYVMPDPREKCLNLVPPGEMEGRLAKLREKALFDKKASDAMRIIGEHSEQLMVDVQGRIRVRDRLLNFAGIDDKVVMIGAFNRVQIWSPALRPDVEAVDQKTLAEAVDQLQF
jgi:MraZ protein